MSESSEPRPPTYFNRKVGDQFIYRGVVHRVVAIHRQKERGRNMTSLGDALPQQLERVRKLREAYVEIGPVGRFGLLVIDNALRASDRAMIEQDLPEMIRCYQELKEIN